MATFRNCLLKVCTALALFSLGTQSALADPGWTTMGKIIAYSVSDNGMDVVIAGGGSPVGCPNNTTYRLLTSTQNYQAIASALLTAIAQRQSVQLLTASCASDGISIVTAVYGAL